MLDSFGKAGMFWAKIKAEGCVIPEGAANPW